MVISCDFIGSLFLLASLSQVSGLCSTCLDERCYDNGECIIGCVPGYVGEYCNEACPSKCLNRRCHLDRIDGTVICTEGCEPGYCHIQCDLPCPGDCVTCDRQCGSCNVTLCNRRYYGADCSEICNIRYEKCDRETGKCIICRRGYFGDECNQKCKACFTRADTIIDKCLSGCDICQSKETCPAGYYGNNCEIPCSRGCDKPEPRCNRATGECSDGCLFGYHGLTCNYKCNEHCLSGRCHRATGECSAGCVYGYHGLTCNHTCNEHCLSGRCHRATGECSAACVSGYHGLTCNYTCSDHCLSGRCNRATGECSARCVSGYHGLTCENTCNEHCLSGRCNRVTGECSGGCLSGYHGLTCNNTCNRFCEGKSCNQHDGVCTSGCISGYKSNLNICEKYGNEGFNTTVAVAVPIIILVCLVAGIAIAVVIWRRRRSRRYSRRDEELLELQELLMPADMDEKAKKQIIDLWIKTKTKITCETCGMIRVSAVDTVVDMLQSGRNWVTITGNAGDGKTTLGYLVLKELQNKPQRQKNLAGKVYSIEEPEECTLLLRLNENSVIMLDDRFGAFTSDNKWKNVMNDIHKHFTTPGNKIKIIFISRKTVMNIARDYLGHFRDSVLDPENVVDLSSMKIKNERLAILDFYLTQSKLKVSSEVKQRVADLDIAYGFPHCSMMYPKLKAKKSDLDIEEFFKTPLKFLDLTTAVLYNKNCKDLFKLMIENDGEFNAYTVKDDAQRESLLKVEREQEGSYITVWKNGVCVFAHPSIYESVLSVICDTDPLFCVKYATLSVIRQKLTLTSDERQKSPTQINVKPVPAVLKALAERFRQDILQGDYTVFGLRFCDNEDFCKELLASCVYSGTADPEQSKQHIDRPGKDGRTMLWTAVHGGRKPIVHALLEHGADVNKPDQSGKTFLLHLCQQNEVDIEWVKEAIRKGADCNMVDETSNSPLLYMCKKKNIDHELLKTLVLKMVPDCTNTKDRRGMAALHYLCGRKSVDIELARFLVTGGRADINLPDGNGATPLHWLCRNSKVTIGDVKQLAVEGHGDINKQDGFGFTPLHYLCSRSVDMKSLVSLIKKVRGDVNLTDQQGNTPLHFICLTKEQSAEYLLKNIPGADGDIVNSDGLSVKDHLLRKGNTPQLFVAAAMDGTSQDLVRGGEKKWTPVLGKENMNDLLFMFRTDMS